MNTKEKQLIGKNNESKGLCQSEEQVRAMRYFKSLETSDRV